MKTPGTTTAGFDQTRSPSEGSTDSRIYLPSITSQEMLDENAQSQNNGVFHGAPQRRKLSRKAMLALLLVFVAIAGAIVAFLATKGGSDDATNASNSSNNNNNNNNANTTNNNVALPTADPSAGGATTNPTAGNATTPEPTKPKSDPTTATYPLTAFAIGDWGATLKTDSCCKRRKTFNGYDLHAEPAVAKMMEMEAATLKPQVVIGHGDSFYWTGIEGDSNQKYRFEDTFESRHKQGSAMYAVPWINVMGNHDYGGGSYICVTGESRTKCGSGAELVANLKKRFDWQAKYKSQHEDRWVMSDHFYKYTITKGDVSMDIFNLDMNDANSHGAHEICCQCYDYSGGSDSKCKNIAVGDANCCGGDVDMYQACRRQFSEWGDEARTKLVEEVKKSTATWKVVNSHYSPYAHYDVPGSQKWMKTLEGLGVQVWIAGHTHGEKHDFASSFGMHFIENGAGGGIQSEGASGIPTWIDGLSRLWAARGMADGGNAYGFFSLQASTEWMKIRFMTFDDKWSLSKNEPKSSDFAQSNVGGVTAEYCYYIPLDGTEGKKC